MTDFPSIELVMNPVVKTFDSTVSVQQLQHDDSLNSFHHFPVVEEEVLIGYCTRQKIESSAPEETLKNICSADIQKVDVSEKLPDVLDKMVETHSTIVFVTRDDNLEGIFTTTDVCRFLSDLMRYGNPSNKDVYDIS